MKKKVIIQVLVAKFLLVKSLVAKNLLNLVLKLQILVLLNVT